jgi:hypothetical protein
MHEMILSTLHVSEEFDNALDKCMGVYNIDTEIVAIPICDFE